MNSEKDNYKKDKIIFVILCFLGLILLSLFTFYLRKSLSSSLQDFSSDFIACVALIAAVALPLWDKLFPNKPIRSYSVDPQRLADGGKTKYA